MKVSIGKLTLAVFVGAFALGTPPAFAAGQNLTFKIPLVKIPVNIENQPISVTAWGVIAMVKAEPGQNVFRLELVADLSDLQQNITQVLRSQLDRSDRCGERIAIQNATLTPFAPASVVVARLHFERWTCVKVFGKERPNKLVGGNGTIEVKLTPAVEEDSTLRLVPEIGRIDAEGPLGELLRSGSIGAALREKITKALLSAMQKGTNFKATLPPVAQEYAMIKNAQFQNGGSGNLTVVLEGEIRISNEQIKLLANQLKERLASQGGPPQ
ncbi:MAG: hypothetical protein WBQ68_17055 [Terriglobales bacterium]